MNAEHKSVCNLLVAKSSIVVKRLHCNDKDVGPNPTATRDKKMDIERPPAQHVP